MTGSPQVGYVPIDTTSPRPQYIYFTLPTIKVISLLMDERDVDRVPRTEVIPLIFEECGLDPDDLPEGWVATGKTTSSVRQAIMYAFRNQKAKYRKAGPALTHDPQRGSWSLTEQGLALGRHLREGGYPEPHDTRRRRRKRENPEPVEEGPNTDPLRDPILKAAGTLSAFSTVSFSVSDLGIEAEDHLMVLALSRLADTNSRSYWGSTFGPNLVLRKGDKWMLHSNGINEALRLHGFTPYPSTCQLYVPVLKAMAHIANCRPERSVSVQDVVSRAVVEAGYDADNLPEGWVMRGPNRSGLWRKIWYAIRNQAGKSNGGWRVNGALTRRGIGRGRWHLTPEGARVAEAALTNMTARWLGEQDPSFMAYLEMAVARKYPACVTLGTVGDHVQAWLLKAIRNDALAKHIPNKTPSAMRSFCTWCCINQAKTNMRKAGHNPVARAKNGARTRGEVKARKERADRGMPEPDYIFGLGDTPEIVFDAAGASGITFIDHRAQAEIEQQVMCRADADVIGRLIRKAFPVIGDDCAKAFCLNFDGYSNRDISGITGISRSRVGYLIRKARVALQSPAALSAMREAGMLPG